MKRSVLTPLYIPIAWGLLISYQSLTQVAVTSFIQCFASLVPSLATWVAGRIDLVVFVHGFAWIFFLTTVVPSLLLGKERSVVVQFAFVLVLTLLGMFFTDFLSVILGPEVVSWARHVAAWLEHPWLAAAYLSAPYIAMLYVDLAARRRRIT